MLEKLNELYNLNITKIIKNKESTIGNVYNIYTKTTKYIMKIYDSKKHTLSMINVHSFLNQNNMNVPKIILNKNNKGYVIINKKYYVIYSYLEGKSLGNIFQVIDKETSILLAKKLKEFHDITKENKYDLDEIPFKIDKTFKRTSILHFDLTKSNIFYNNKWQDKIGFIDFDDAKYGPSIYDVAILISLLFISKKYGINKEGMETFINTYYEDETIKNEEVPYLKECAIKWLDYTIKTNNFDASIKESFEIKKQLLEQ